MEISVVVPVYGCRGTLRALHARLTRVLARLTDAWEIVLVEDRSPDGCWQHVAELAHGDPHVVALRLSRNFGQDAAITAGLRASRGRWTVVIDCDLEEPPEAIAQLYAKAQEGFDLVRGVRTGASRSRLRALAGRAWLWLLLEGDRRPDYGTLSLLSRPVVEAFLSLRDRDREYRLILDWLGFRQANVPFERQRRPAGESSYTLRRLLQLAFSGMFFRTTALLHAVVYLGLLVSTVGLGFAAYVVWSYFAVGAPAGYTSLAVLVLVIGGITIVSVGVVGLYVGRVFEQVKGRPLYIVDAEIRDGLAVAPHSAAPPAVRAAPAAPPPRARRSRSPAG